MIEFSRRNDSIICDLPENVVASQIPGMRSRLLSYLEEDSSWNELVFNCLKVQTLDSIGVNFIVGAFKKTNELQKLFRITECNPPVMNVLKMFKLDSKFKIEPAG